MAEVNANINIDIDTSDALASLRQLQSRISQFNRSVIESNAAAVNAQKQLTSQLVAQTAASKAFAVSTVNVESSVSRLGRAIDKNKLSLGEYFKYGIASSRNFSRVFDQEHNEVMSLAEERVKKLQTQYIALGNAQNGVNRAMALRPLQLHNADAAIAIQRQQIFNKLLHDGSTSLINFGKNTQWAGRQLMVGFTVPLTIFGGMAGQVFMNLEKSVIKFRRVYGELMTPLDETNAMIEQVQQLGKEYTKYGIAVSDTIGLAADAAAAGAQGADLIAATEQSTRLATLGQLDQNQALEATIALQSAFRQSSEELARSVDFLNAVENQTVVSLDDITVAIPKVAPVIQGLGGDVQDLAIFMAAMREGGVNAAEGANALKSGLASLINPTKQAREQLNKVGIDIDSILSKNKGDLRAIVMEFGSALSTLDKFSRQQTLAKLFGKYQFARLGALFDNINRSGSQAQRVIELTGQSVEDLAKLSEKELGAIEQATSVKFTAAIEKLKLAIAPIGEAFLKVATPIIEVVTKLVDKFNELSPGVKQFIVILTAGLGVVVPTIIMLIGLFANFAGNAIKGLSLINNFFNRMRGGGNVFNYLENEQLDAMAAAASLENATNNLTGSLNVQRKAVDALSQSYGRYIAAANTAVTNLPQGFVSPRRPGKPVRKMATGGIVGGTGNKDSEPALLMPGEFVVNRKAAQKYGPILQAMNEGTISKYAEGTRQKRKLVAVPGRYESAHFSERRPLDDSEIQAIYEKTSASVKEVIDMARKNGQQIYGYTNEVVQVQDDLNAALRDDAATIQQVKRDLIGKADFVHGELVSQMKKLGATPQEISSAIQTITSSISSDLNLMAEDVVLTEKDFSKLVTDAYKKLDQQTDSIASKAKSRMQEITTISDPLERENRGKKRQRISLPGTGSYKGKRETYTKGMQETSTATGVPIPFETKGSFDIAPMSRAAQMEAERFSEIWKQLDIETKKRLVSIRNNVEAFNAEIIREAEKLGVAATTGAATGAKTNSNSRATIKTGEFIAGGLVEGMQNGLTQVNETANNLGRSATSQVASGSSDIRKILAQRGLGPEADAARKRDYQYQVNIRRLEQERIQRTQALTLLVNKQTGAVGQIAKKRAEELYILEQQQLAIDENNLRSQRSVTIAQERLKLEQAIQVSEISQQGMPAAGDINMANKKPSRFGNLMRGGRGAGIGMGLMSVAMMAPMLPGQVGEFSSQLQPAIMTLSTISMLEPLFRGLANPVGLLIAGIAAAIGGVLLISKVGQDLANRGRELSDAMIGTSQSLDNAAKYFDKQTYTQQLAERRVEAVTGTKIGKQTNQEAQGFISSDAGQQLLQDIKKTKDLVGGAEAQKVLQNRLESMMLSGIIGPKLAYSIATEIGNELGDTQFAVSTSARIKEVIGYNGENLKDTDGRMQILADIIADATSLENVFKNAGVTWDGTSWFMQVVMQVTGKGTSDIAAENIAGNIVNAQKLIGEQLAKNRLEFENGTITAEEFYDTNMKILNAGKQAGSTYESAIDALKRAYSDTDLVNEINTVNQQISDNFANTMTSALGPSWKKFVEESGNTIGNALYDVVPQFGGDLQQTGLELINGFNKINLFDASDIQNGITYYEGRMIEVQGYLDKAKKEGDDESVAKYQEIIDKLTESQNNLKNIQIGQAKLQIAVESGVISPQSLDNLLKGGQDYLELVYKLSAAPDESAQLFYQILEESRGKGIRADFAIKILGMSPDEVSKIGQDLFSITNLPPVLSNPILVEWKDKSPEEISQELKSMRKDIALFESMDTAKEVSVYWNDQSWATNFKQFTIDWDYIARLDPLQKSIYMNYIQNIVPPTDPKERVLWEKWIMEGGIPGIESAPSTTDQQKPTPETDGGGGGGTKENPYADFLKSMMDDLKLYTNINKVLGKLKDNKKNMEDALKTLRFGGGLVAEMRKNNLSEAMISALLSQGYDKAKEIYEKMKKRKELDVRNQEFLFASAGKRTSEAYGKARTAKLGQNMAGALFARGERQDVVQAITSDEGATEELNALFESRRKAKGKKQRAAADQRINSFLDSQRKQIVNAKDLERAYDPVSALLDDMAFVQEQIAYIQERQIKNQQKKIDGINKEIEALQEANSDDQNRIRLLERQKEMIERQIEELERANEMDQRKIDGLKREDEMRQRISSAISHDLEIMSRKEQEIKDKYQERLDALDKIQKINENIINQQKSQLDLSQALSTGDIYAAAQAQQEMQAQQAQFAMQEMRGGLQAGMQNQVEGLTTPGGLTRKQAEQQIADIKEQSYETSLQIRDIEDKIYERNQQMIPLKDQIYNYDLLIRSINDEIFDRETKIIEITENRLEPAQLELEVMQDKRDEQEQMYRDQVKALELGKDLQNMTESQRDSVFELASQWAEVGRLIAEANKLAKEEQITSFDKKPSRMDFGTNQEYLKKLAEWQTTWSKDAIEKRRQERIDVAKKRIDRSVTAKRSRKFAGGIIKGYAMGSIVPGDGSRDSVPAMLTPGEFIIRKASVDKYGPSMMESINSGSFRMPSYPVPNRYNTSQISPAINNTNMTNSSVYNTYSINVPVTQPNASADEIAQKVMTKIRNVDNMAVRSFRGY